MTVRSAGGVLGTRLLSTTRLTRIAGSAEITYTATSTTERIVDDLVSPDRASASFLLQLLHELTQHVDVDVPLERDQVLDLGQGPPVVLGQREVGLVVRG